MTEQKNNDKEKENEVVENCEEKDTNHHAHTVPQIPWKSPKWPNFPNPHKFGAGSNFFNNSFNKQRQWRAAGRWR